MEPDWLKKAREEGRIISETGTRLDFAIPRGPVAVSLNPKLSEAEFQQQVIDAAHARGWRVAHFRKVRIQRADGKTFWETPVAADGKGFLDLELVRERLVKIELKVGSNTETPEQLDWCNTYAKAKVEWYVFYPEDWSAIIKVLE